MRHRTKFVALATAFSMLAFTGVALAVDSYPGHDGHVGTDVPADPGAGRHRVSEHVNSSKNCATNQHINVQAKIVVAAGGGSSVRINAAEVESLRVAIPTNTWDGAYDNTIEGELGSGVYPAGTWTVINKPMPDSHNNSAAVHAALEIAQESPDPDLDDLFITRTCVAD